MKNDLVITGASGFIAKNLRQFLISQGFQVIGISRRNYSSSKFEKKIISNTYDEKKIVPRIKNSQCIIHLIGIGKTTVTNDFKQTNLDLTKKVISIAKKANIKKIIYLSGLGVSRKSTVSYFVSKYLAEKQIINSGLNYTVFRPSYVIGKDDYLTKNLKKQLKSGKIIIPGTGQYHIQPIMINDVCKIILQSVLNKKFNNRVLDLVGPERLTYENYIQKFSKNRAVIQKIPIEKIFHNTINNLNSRYDVDDLLILLGDFNGNYPKLQKISGLSIEKIS